MPDMAIPKKPAKVVILGGINMDLIGLVPRLASPGETVMGTEFYTALGGKGANQAVAASRLGAKVSMVGRVGKDAFGPRLLDGLRGYGIDVSGIAQDPNHPSGVAMILLDAQRQNHIMAIYGANMELGDDELQAVVSGLEGADALLLQNEIPVCVSLAAAEAAKERGVRVIWDPSPAHELPHEAYSAIDVLIPNQTEVEFLTGISVSDVASAHAAAEALLSRGVASAAIKLGDLGVYYASNAGSGHVLGFKVAVVDTVAAGDAFGGALAVALTEGRDLPEAIRFACAAGALAVTRRGAQESMPSRGEVDSLFEYR